MALYETLRSGNPSRGKYHGVMQILAFNIRLYVAGTIVMAVTAIGLSCLSGMWKTIAFAAFVLAAHWMFLSLAASHWVYDRSPIYKWAWLAECLPAQPQRWANLHAGLDESSLALTQLFSGTHGTVLDFFDPTEMTEPSIAEARLRSTSLFAAKRIDWRSIPLGNSELDTTFLIFAAHEIRSTKARMKFFSELVRTLKDSGRIVVVEHLRDWRNFLAYGPGFWHFQSRRTWLHAAAQANLQVDRELRITPFVRIFVFRKAL